MGAVLRSEEIALSRETQVLLGAVRWFVGAATEDELVELLRLGLDWEVLLEQAECEGITGLVTRALDGVAQRGDLVPALDRWHAATRAVAASNMSALSELAAMRVMLRREGRSVILLKGAALLDDEYGGHVGLRPLGDIDLLVRPSDLPSVTGWLRSRGYEPVSSSSPFFSRGVVSFDLHTEIVGSDWVGRKARAFRLDPAALWREARPLEPDDRTTFFVLSPVHLRLQLVVHALKHSYSRLIWLVDLALVLRDAPWPSLLEQARAAGALRPLAYAVSALALLLGLGMPDAVREELPALGPLERAFLRLVARRRGVETPGELLVALSIPGAMGKAAYLAELVFPRRHALARHYPMSPSWLLYPRRALRLVSLGLQEGTKLWYRRGG
jgi:hypothetical protein